MLKKAQEMQKEAKKLQNPAAPDTKKKLAEMLTARSRGSCFSARAPIPGKKWNSRLAASRTAKLHRSKSPRRYPSRISTANKTVFSGARELAIALRQA